MRSQAFSVATFNEVTTPGVCVYDWLWKGAATGDDWQTLQEGRFIVEEGIS